MSNARHASKPAHPSRRRLSEALGAALAIAVLAVVLFLTLNHGTSSKGTAHAAAVVTQTPGASSTTSPQSSLAGGVTTTAGGGASSSSSAGAAASASIPAGGKPASSSASTAATAPASITYVVKPGDNLAVIAEWFHMNGYDQLYAANKTTLGDDPDLIHPGQRITISNGQMTTS